MNDNELSALVAEHVAGWKLSFTHPGIWWLDDEWATTGDLPPYATSANAVLPLLAQREWICRKEEHLYWISISGKESDYRWAATFARAACLALLRAHGVTLAGLPDVNLPRFQRDSLRDVGEGNDPR